MALPPPPPPPRARRSLYQQPPYYQQPPPRRRRGFPCVIVAVLLVGVLAIGGVAGYRVVGFLQSVLNGGNPVQILQQQLDPPAGSIAYKIKHGQRINVLALGYGGPENDAPYLTDSIMAVSIDPVTKRVVEISVPRDLYVRIDAWQDGRKYTEKINAAFEVPNMPRAFGPGPLKPAYTGKDGAGHLAEAVVGGLTGLSFDRYAAVDFKAFRTVVDALGGITVHMDGPLDDCHYPDYHNGYVNHGVPVGRRCPPGAGIHFQAGTYTVSGEQALQIARSRDAIEPEQATDFARAKRQQMIISGIKAKAVSVNGLARAPQLMDAVQADFKTDMDVNDVTALYNLLGHLPDSSIQHFAITDQNLVVDVNGTGGDCGGPRGAFVLCPVDSTYHVWQTVFGQLPLPSPLLAEKAPVQLVNASRNTVDLQQRTTDTLRQMGLNVSDGARHAALLQSTVVDYSGGKYPQTAAWLKDFFGANVVPAASAGITPAPGQQTDGLVVVMGSDYARRWIGQG
ncbi:MAG: LytR family transcriptional regulator [Chloroflexi bacterium]|nr:MAG: LytR family transcriptional regulator [Chloroflexota bacterium]